MTRSVNDDFLLSFRFHANVVGIDGQDKLVVPGRPQAGFSAITIPELSVEPVEYSEGHMIYTIKQPGKPSVSECMLSRGVMRGDLTFWLWILQVAEGPGEYRGKVEILDFQRNSLPRTFPTTGVENSTLLSLNAPSRIIHLYECWPQTCKVEADHDATAAEVSVAELTLAVEHFDVEDVPLA